MVPRIPSWTKGVAVAARVPPRPSFRGQVLQLQFSPSLRLFVDKRCCSSASVSLRGSSWTKGVAVAVLRGPPWPFVDKRCCSCSSPCPSVALRGQKVLQLQFSVSLRGPSWTKGVAVAVLRVPPWPFVDKRCCSCSSPCPSVALRGQKVLQLQFSVSLRGPSWTKGVAVAVLRVPPWPFVDKRCCSCSSPCPSVALRGQKVLQLQFSVPSVALRGQKVLQLQFSVVLRGPSWTKGVAVAVLRVPPWPFVDKRCCSCSSPCPSVALRGQKVLQLQFSVSLRGPSWTKGVAVAVLRVPPWPFVDKRCCSCSSPCPSVSSWTKGVAVAVLRVPPWIKKPFFLPYRVY